LIQPRTWVVDHGPGLDDDPLNIRLEPATSTNKRDVL
jgi:hypothetical protein